MKLISTLQWFLLCTIVTAGSLSLRALDSPNEQTALQRSLSLQETEQIFKSLQEHLQKIKTRNVASVKHHLQEIQRLLNEIWHHRLKDKTLQADLEKITRLYENQYKSEMSLTIEDLSRRISHLSSGTSLSKATVEELDDLVRDLQAECFKVLTILERMKKPPAVQPPKKNKKRCCWCF